MKKLYLLLFMSLFLLSFTSAVNECGNDNSYLGTFKQSDTTTLRQTCNSCSYVNLSGITYPNSTNIHYNFPMIKSGVDYSFDFLNTTQLGCYSYSVYGDKGGVLTTENIDFKITQSGLAQTTGGSIVYIAVLGLLIFLFFLNSVGIAKLPGGNSRADSGNVISISVLKYLKSTLFVVGWGLIISILFISSNIAEAYLGHSFSNFLFQLFKIVASWQIILLVVMLWIIYVVVNIFKDIKLKQFFDRGYVPQ